MNHAAGNFSKCSSKVDSTSGLYFHLQTASSQTQSHFTHIHRCTNKVNVHWHYGAHGDFELLTMYECMGKQKHGKQHDVI